MKKNRYVNTHVTGKKVSIAKHNKVEWMNIDHVTESSAKRLNDIIHSNKYDTTYSFGVYGLTAFINTK